MNHHQQTSVDLFRIITGFACIQIATAIGASALGATEPFANATATMMIVEVDKGESAASNPVDAKGISENAATDPTVKLNPAKPANDNPAPKKESTADAPAKGSAHADRMQGILKPMREILLQPSHPTAAVPTNRAQAIMPSYDVYLGPSGSSPHAPQRYTIPSMHNPLYYEEINLERCGQGHGCLTPAVSAIHFMSSTLLLPYRLAGEPPCQVQCSYGDCRCCQTMPCQRPLKCRARSVASQMALTAGFVFLLL